MKGRSKPNRKSASHLSLTYQATKYRSRRVLITAKLQYFLCQEPQQQSVEGRQVRTGARRNITGLWRQCFSVTFLKCGERLLASFSTRIHHVRSGNWGWSRQPCAGNLATGEPHVSAARLMAVLSGTTVHAQPQPPGALHQLSKNNNRAPSP